VGVPINLTPILVASFPIFIQTGGRKGECGHGVLWEGSHARHLRTQTHATQSGDFWLGILCWRQGSETSILDHIPYDFSIFFIFRGYENQHPLFWGEQKLHPSWPLTQRANCSFLGISVWDFHVDSPRDFRGKFQSFLLTMRVRTWDFFCLRH